LPVPRRHLELGGELHRLVHLDRGASIAVSGEAHHRLQATALGRIIGQDDLAVADRVPGRRRWCAALFCPGYQVLDRLLEDARLTVTAGVTAVFMGIDTHHVVGRRRPQALLDHVGVAHVDERLSGVSCHAGDDHRSGLNVAGCVAAIKSSLLENR
jgi:hypothetical protein